ncbi:MAG: hypothetical protein MUC76_12750 [Spirochaetes bacterium]|jgi:hypothetical protein|nr:hypothetical protein [Spirochaetota bacterium]
MRQIEFIVSGNSGKERADSLKLLYERWRENPLPQLEDNTGKKPRIRVIITGPRRESSIEHAVRYALRELEDGIGEAGGTIWDGTHVQITMDEA